ncbi:MAG TPA: hypothetical protein PKN44_13050 [Bacteroidales bacterium]|nr:hypothetical protein [Bacteroidales bacterium]
MPKQVPRAGAHIMSNLTVTAKKSVNGGSSPEEKTIAAIMKPIVNPQHPVTGEVKPLPVPETESKKEMTLMEKILKVENLQLIIEKRKKLVQTRSELERFQTASNDFNCSMRLNDSDGNVFTTAFTPGIKKVIDFLKSSFDASISEVEKKIEL